MSWFKGLQGPQGPFFLCLIFLVFTLAHTIPHQKTENDLVFEEDDSSELNLILSEPKSLHHRKSQADIQKQRTNVTRSRKNWWGKVKDDDEKGGVTPRSSLSSTTPISSRSSTSTKKSAQLWPAAGSPSRKRAARVPETDDEDLVGGSGDESSGDIQPEVPKRTTLPTAATSTDRHSSFERKFFRISLDIGKSWSPALETSSSSIFKIYHQDLERVLQDVMGFDVEEVQVVQFKNVNDPSFVRCVFDLGLTGQTQEQIEDEFNTYLEVGRIGSLRVRRDGFLVRDMGGGCSESEIPCRDGACISVLSRCDGVNDCDDASDEQGCPAGPNPTIETPAATTPAPPVVTSAPVTARPTPGTGQVGEVPVPLPTLVDGCRADDQVRCHDGQSYICSDQVCDGNHDCPDHSDEMGCGGDNCPTDHFSCDLTKCQPKSKVCNGVIDCEDGSDEANCVPHKRRHCNNNGQGFQFACISGQCVDFMRKCDGVDDCEDASDEFNCQCLPFEWECDIGDCILRSSVCDQQIDCLLDGSDEKYCRPKLNCTASEFRCRDDSCVPSSARCNRIYECSDGSDEEGCRPPSCTSYEHQCRDGTCVGKTLLCDGYPDCPDGGDERNCPDVPVPCSSSQFRCGDGTCIANSERCNGRPDCRDYSDEQNCTQSCGSGEYQCADGTCIPEYLRCSGAQECPDFSDETNCATCRNSFRCSNGKCIENSRKCDQVDDCAEGDDEDDCFTKCDDNQFECDSTQCILKTYRCDGFRDCGNGADEIGCGPTRCTENQFTCQAGGCVLLSERCNQRIDCADGSDEFGCPTVCRSDQFRCNDGVCIDNSRKCNRRPDCPDGSDERHCGPPPSPDCLPGQFTCRSRDQCIESRFKCDGIYQCNDFSDEENCVGERPEHGGGLNLKTYPTDQTIKQGNEVVFQCRDEGPQRASVRWSRGNGLPLPTGSRDFNGRLEMPNIAVDHTGTYICEAVGYPSSTPGSRVSVYLRVDPYEAPPTRPPTACGVNEATCGNGNCISKNQVCDGAYDCEDHSDELRCGGRDGCEPNEFQCSNKKCVPKTWRCDGDDDCGDGTDESQCAQPPPGSPCLYNEFRCATTPQCIPKGFHCDKEIDCRDSSDETGCSPPSILRPPPPLVTIHIGETFNISCTAVGTPTPEVVWRLNWGHVPDKCVSSSVNGVGYLTCNSMQLSEQGAYSCEAINSLGSTFAIPDCVLVVHPTPGVCSSGFFNDLATSSRECLPCFCFGHTSQCSSASLYTSQLAPPADGYRLIGVSQDLIRGSIEIQDRRYSIPASVLRPASPYGIQAQTSSIRTLSLPSDVTPYFALPTPYNGNLLRSYGGYLRYSLRYRGSGRVLSAPDVIIKGNGLTLIHVGGDNRIPGRENAVSVRYWPGQWFKKVSVRPGGDQSAAGVEPASREEILQVLAQVEYLLIRAQYDQGTSLDTTITNIKMDRATENNAGQGQVSFIESCRCPQGYAGLSCEECSPGYERRQQGPWIGICVKSVPLEECQPGTYLDFQNCRPCPCPSDDRRFGSTCYKDTDNQITCNCNPGHTGRNCETCAPGYEQNRDYPFNCRPSGARCDIEGSIAPNPDVLTGRCICKDFASGTLCNECKAETFHLSALNQYGCISCFCMGITSTCGSSNWYRTQETAIFVNSAQGFTLVDESQRDVIRDGFLFDRNSRELGFKEFSRYPPEIYYWQLPYNFLGDKVTSYGGYLNYTVRYVPPPGGKHSPNNAADVEINGNDIRLLYFRKGAVPANVKETISVPLLEQYWQRQDGQAANREHLLMALANLDALLIKATYTTSTVEAHLSNVILDYALARNTGGDRAFAVEQCSCPQGYIGLSCQECAYGYTRSLRGLYLGLCEPCSCNGHSEECDPKSGVCRNCRGHTTGDFCEECEDGYKGDPRTNECTLEVPRCFCDSRGSSRPDCPDGRNCVCKGNTEGATCNLCKQGTFALQELNPQGCLECFCSRISTECASANLYRLTIDMQLFSGPHGFTLTDSSRTASVQEISVDTNSGELSYRYPPNARSERIFWSLPQSFTGNRVASYGGKLRATRRYLVRPGSDATPGEDIDVILVGNNGVSLYWIYGSLLSGQEVGLEVSLRETSGWRHLEGAANMASREEILSVLVDLQAILIRASFTEEMEATYIKDVSLDDAVRQYTPNGVVMEVEECRCPPGYEGLSCEACSAGFYRDPNDHSAAIGGVCKRCPCGDNSEGCRFEYGAPLCLCRPGFIGPDCETRVGGPTAPTPAPPHTGPQIHVSISEPIIQVVHVGSSVSFRCGARSPTGTQLRITWSRESGVIPIGRARDDGRGLLVIAEVRPQDTGTYLCTATDGYNTNVERAYLTVSGGGTPPVVGSRPEVFVSPGVITVSTNQAVEIRCTATGVPTPTITWTEGRSGALPPHVRVSGGILRIPAARQSDGAEYFCSASNNMGTNSARAIVYVNPEESTLPPIPPVFGLVVTISPSEYEARPGETVRFRCDSSERDSRIQWTRLSGVLPQSASQSPDGTLNIFTVRDVDSGIYVCTASSSSGQTSQSQARLSVSFIGSPPVARIEPERQTVSQGSHIEIRCIPTGSPTPTIEWSKVGSSLPPSVQISSEVLHIPSAQVSDRGVYVCTVENSAGKSLASAIVEVERRETPQIEMYPSARQTVIREGSALFQCRIVAGIPSPTVTWTRTNGLRLPTNVEEIQGGVLRFNRVTGEEKGQYMCTAESVAGTTTAIATLEIQAPPKVTITPSSPHRVRSGDRVRLECRAEGDPLPSVSWKKLQPGQLDGVDLLPFPTARGTPETAVYEIARVSKSDEGSYSCSGRNDAGLDEGRLQLLVDDFEEPEYPEPERDRDRDHGREHERPHTPSHRPREEVYYFPVGSRAELRCIQAFEGNVFDQLYFDWGRGDTGHMPSDYDTRDGILYINEVKAEDAGRYACTGTNRQGQVVFTVEARLEIIGISPPRIELQPARQVVRRGDTVNIMCIATGEQPITINWFKTDLKPLPSSIIVNGPQLTFRGIEVTDAGRYACRATNAGGTAEAVAEVIVNANGPPIPRPRGREQTGYTGSTVDLRCTVRGSRVVWKKDDGPLPRSAISLGSTLTLLNLQLEDAGRYTCETDDGSDYVDLSVEVGRVDIWDHTESCNSTEFRCSNGECIPIEYQCDGVGKCHCVDCSDEIACTDGDDDEDRVRPSRGIEDVSVRVSANRDLLRVGEDVEIRCDVSGHTSPVIRWTKARGDFHGNVQTYGNILRVNDVVPENGGVYRCIVNTPSAVYEEDYALTIQANPDRIQNSAPIETRTAPFGSNVMMDCRTDLAGPIEYTWSKQGGLIPTSATTHGATLSIPDLSPDDAGTYICSATNAITSMDIPTVLVVTGVVPYFTQAPSSYMSLQTLPDSYLKFDVDISFKAEDKNGLILYNGQKRDGTGDFISFGLSNGYPEFRFDVGSGPAVIRGDRQVDIGRWQTVKLSRDRADGSMIVNERGPYIGSIKGSFQGLNLIEPLYIGGVPNFNNIHRLSGQSKGFVGCISELIIGGKKQQLLRDSQTSRGVSTCDTCIVNTCSNGGVCQEGLTNRGYTCICAPGYSGEDCETAGEACYPGACGVGKCVNIPGRFECYCPFGKTGIHCERDVVIYEPSFSGDSYLSYPTPKALKKLKMAMKVKPDTEEDGLLMYCSQTEDGLGDYTALAIKDKHLEFQYDTGSGPAVIRSKKEIKAGEWLQITIERNLQDGELIIGGSDIVKGKSPGSTRGLNLKTPLFLGGYDKHRVQLNSNIRVDRGFAGCVSELAIVGMDVDLVNSVLEGANIENCGSNAQFCSKNLCQNGGTCTTNSTMEHWCECPLGYAGRLCEIRDACSTKPCKNGGTCYKLDKTYKCSCMKGFFGRNCHEEMKFSESVAFRGEGYLELSKELLPHYHASEQEIVEIEISTTSSHGILFWHGQHPTEVDPMDDYLSVALNDGKVEFRWELGSGPANLVSDEKVNNGSKHKISLRRQGSDGSITINDGPAYFGSSSGIVQTLNTRGNIYIGGVPDPSRMTYGMYSDGFIGCIHSLTIQNSEPINLNEEAISAANVGPCASNGNGHHHHRNNSHKPHSHRNGNGNGHKHPNVIDTEDNDNEEYYLEGRHRVRNSK